MTCRGCAYQKYSDHICKKFRFFCETCQKIPFNTTIFQSGPENEGKWQAERTCAKCRQHIGHILRAWIVQTFVFEVRENRFNLRCGSCDLNSCFHPSTTNMAHQTVLLYSMSSQFTKHQTSQVWIPPTIQCWIKGTRIWDSEVCGGRLDKVGHSMGLGSLWW